MRLQARKCRARWRAARSCRCARGECAQAAAGAQYVN